MGQRIDTSLGNINKVYDVLKNKQAPATIGKPVFEKDFEHVKMTGAKSMAEVFGKATIDDEACSSPLNFGSKASTGLLPEDTRIRLFLFKKLLSNVMIQAQCKTKLRDPSMDAIKSVPLYENALVPMLKAFNVTDFSSWLPTVHTRFYFEEYEIPLLVADLFDQLPMESSTIKVPGALGLLEGRREADDATFDEQANTEADYLVTAENCVVHSKITQDLLDDTAPAIIDKYRKEVVKGIGRAVEKAILNGTRIGTTHIDADSEAGSAKLFVKAWNGLRKLAFDNDAVVGAGKIVYDHEGDSPSKLLFARLLKLMKIFSMEKSDLAWIMPVSVGHDLVTGAIPELFTAFAFGGLASNVTGAVPPVFGVNGTESSYVREDLLATGKAGDPVVAADTKTCLILVKKSRFMNFVRQATKVWASPSLPSSDTLLMSAKWRGSWAGNPQSAQERSVVMGINIETLEA
jgi:hypothetical protein